MARNSNWLNSRQALTLLNDIIEDALAAVSPLRLIGDSLRRGDHCLVINDEKIDLTPFQKFWLVAIGKVAPYLTSAFLEHVNLPLAGGICLYLPPKPDEFSSLRLLPSSHPLPSRKSVQGAREILSLVSSLGESDLLITLISGGGSAQLTLPLAGISLAAKKKITQDLMKAGANIRELNTVRKHLSAIKGGRLAQAAYPTQIINLVVSDVIGNDLEVIASGPTWFDSSTYEDAYLVLRQYELWDSSPLSIKRVIEKGRQGLLTETLKPGDKVFSRVKSFIIGDNIVALRAAQARAARQGWQSIIVSNQDQGEARNTARNYAGLLASLMDLERSFSRPLLLLSGGELTVTVQGKGRGGRNQEFALAMLLEMKKLGMEQGNWLVVSVGSDGRDGPTDAAGAWVDGRTWEKVKQQNLSPQEFLQENDSYNFFKKLRQLIYTGPTQTNVMDLRFFLLW